MGVCASTIDKEAASTSVLVDKNNRLTAELERRKIKLLLLGPGESGKSTLFKQMKHIYGRGYSESDRVERREVVHTNIGLAFCMCIITCFYISNGFIFLSLFSFFLYII